MAVYRPFHECPSEFTRERISTDHITKDNNTFTHCASTTLNTTSSSSVFATSSTGINPSASASQTNSSSVGGGAIGGIIVGALAVLAGAIVAFWLHRRQRFRKSRSFMPPDLFDGNTAEMSEQQIAASRVDPYDHQGGNSSLGNCSYPRIFLVSYFILFYRREHTN